MKQPSAPEEALAHCGQRGELQGTKHNDEAS